MKTYEYTKEKWQSYKHNSKNRPCYDETYIWNKRMNKDRNPPRITGEGWEIHETT